MGVGDLLTVRALVEYHKTRQDDTWIDLVFAEDSYPEWDADGVAPKSLYVLYHSVLEQLLQNDASVQHHRQFCVRKARNFNPACSAKLNTSPPDAFYSQFSQADLAAVGV